MRGGEVCGQTTDTNLVVYVCVCRVFDVVLRHLLQLGPLGDLRKQQQQQQCLPAPCTNKQTPCAPTISKLVSQQQLGEGERSVLGRCGIAAAAATAAAAAVSCAHVVAGDEVLELALAVDVTRHAVLWVVGPQQSEGAGDCGLDL